MAAHDAIGGIGDIGDIDDMGHSGDIERVLRAEEPMEPSPGFSWRVMESVRREAAVPAPIAFPWQRLLAGIAAWCALIAAGAAALSSSAVELRLPALHWDDPALTAAASGLGWTMLALAGTYLLTRLARRLMET